MAGTAEGRAAGAAAGAEVRLTLNMGAIEKLLASPEGPVGLMLLRKAVTVEGTAKRLCPVDTGRLRASITHALNRDAKGLVAYIGTNVAYAIFVELGTRYMRARSYLRPALRSAR